MSGVGISTQTCEALESSSLRPHPPTLEQSAAPKKVPGVSPRHSWGLCCPWGWVQLVQRFRAQVSWTGGLRRGCLWCVQTAAHISSAHTPGCQRLQSVSLDWALGHRAAGICSPTLAVSGAPDFPWVRGIGIEDCQVIAGTLPSL